MVRWFLARSMLFKLVAVSTVVQVLMVFLLVANSVRLIHHGLIEVVALRHHDIELALNTSLARRIAEGNTAHLQGVLDRIRKESGIDYLVLFGTNHKLLASSGWASRRPLPRARKGFPAAAADWDYFHTKMNVTLGGRIYGTLHYGFSTHFLEHAHDKLVRNSLIVASGGMLLSVLALVLAGYWLTRHLSMLTRASEEVTSGNYDVQLPVMARDEVGRLTQTFNRMAESIRSRIEALKRSEEKFHAIADYTYGWENWVGADGRLIWVNSSVYRLTGYTAAECLEMADFPLPLVADEDAAKIRQCVAEAAAGSTGHHVEFRAKHKAGGLRWCALSWQPIYSGSGENLGYRSSIEDINERKAMEESLRASEARLEAAEQVAHVGNWEWDVDADGLTWSDENYRIFGMKPQERPLVHNDFLSAVYPADRLRVQWAAEEALHHDKPYSIDHRIVLADGSLRSVHGEGMVMRDANNAPRRMFGVMQDISQRKQIEENLARLNRLYSILRDSAQAVFHIREHARLYRNICRIAVDSGLFRMAWVGMVDGETGVLAPVAHWGYEAGYLQLLHITVGDDKLGHGPSGTAVRQGGYIVCGDIAHDTHMMPWRKEALRRGYLSSAAFPLSQDGRVVGVFNLYAAEAGFFTDDIVDLLGQLSNDISFALDFIAEEKRREAADAELSKLTVELETRVVERTRQLEVANKELEAFSYSVSHDLRAPLRAMEGFSQILLRKYGDQLDETGKDYLERVVAANRHMADLIGDLLQLSRVARSDLHRGTVDLSEMARAVAGEARKNDPAHGYPVEIRDGLAVQGDARLLRVVLTNLLSNAWKFSAKRPDPQVEFGAKTIRGEQVFYVRDNGAGFDIRYADKLFTAFQRLHSVQEFEGTGVGLATVQRIIHRHGGRVWAEGEVGKGATFYFTLG